MHSNESLRHLREGACTYPEADGSPLLRNQVAHGKCRACRVRDLAAGCGGHGDVIREHDAIVDWGGAITERCLREDLQGRGLKRTFLTARMLNYLLVCLRCLYPTLHWKFQALASCRWRASRSVGTQIRQGGTRDFRRGGRGWAGRP